MYLKEDCLMEQKKVLETEKCKGKKIHLSNYTHLRAYHACRPENIQVYRDEGLIPYDKKAALEDAIQKLSGGKVSAEKVKAQFETMWENSESNRHPRVWLAVEKSELLDASCHYLIYGSEFLNALSMHLGCRDKLKSIGQPTIVVCDVPLKDISEVWLDGLEEAIKNKSSSMRSIAVSSVVPQNIVDFIHPTGLVNDPYTGMKYSLSRGVR